MLYIGIDLGTSAVKLLLMDEKGAIKNIVSKEYPLHFPHPGWSEQDPADWVAAVRAGIPELIKDCDRTKIAGIGAGGQMHGLVALDKDGEVIRPAILWNDGRTSAETDYLNNEIGRAKSRLILSGLLKLCSLRTILITGSRENFPPIIRTPRACFFSM